MKKSEGKHRLESWMCPRNGYGRHEWKKTGDGAQSAEYFVCIHCRKTLVD